MIALERTQNGGELDWNAADGVRGGRGKVRGGSVSQGGWTMGTRGRCGFSQT